jgi:hypothetical protein
MHTLEDRDHFYEFNANRNRFYADNTLINRMRGMTYELSTETDG